MYHTPKTLSKNKNCPLQKCNTEAPSIDGIVAMNSVECMYISMYMGTAAMYSFTKLIPQP